MYDHLLWYAKDKERVTFRRAFVPRSPDPAEFSFVEESNGSRRRMSDAERHDPDKLPSGSRLFSRLDLYSSGYTPTCIYDYEFEGTVFKPETGKSWKTTKDGMAELEKQRRLMKLGTKLYFIFYFDDYPLTLLTNLWDDTAGGFSEAKRFVVETHPKVIQRCLLLTTDPGDLVLDPTCGSGTTAFVAEQWGRRWITCDTSRVAITLAKQRLLTAVYGYYELSHTEEGVGSGFRYKTAPHITLGSIAQREPSMDETLYDQPLIDKSRIRVPGPFTVEAVPAPTVRSLDDIDLGPATPKAQGSLADFRDAATPLLDTSVARKGPTLRHTEWRDELLKTGLRGKGGHHIDFARVEPLAGTRWLHADAETKGVKPERVVISFGPEYSLLDRNQVELAWEEARTLSPRPAMIVFAAFEFDPDAAREIDSLTKEKTGMTFLTAQMNADLLTEDLKKKRASNQGFWLVGRPDVELREIAKGDHKGKWEAEVKGFDYYNTRSGTIDSGDASKIAMWLLDTDYDGRSLYPRQVFFPMADDVEGWAKLARNLKAELDSELIEKYRGKISLPFEAGPHKRIAVKVIDDRGIESLKVVDLK
jgi:adenine-specific DNA-methyltransferase